MGHQENSVTSTKTVFRSPLTKFSMELNTLLSYKIYKNNNIVSVTAARSHRAHIYIYTNSTNRLETMKRPTTPQDVTWLLDSLSQLGAAAGNGNEAFAQQQEAAQLVSRAFRMKAAIDNSSSPCTPWAACLVKDERTRDLAVNYKYLYIFFSLSLWLSWGYFAHS